MNELEKDIICELKDGYVLNFTTEQYSYGGCETCDYGSEYINECSIITSNNDIKITVNEMYEYAITSDFWVKFFCKNVINFLQMTEEEFICFVKEKIKDNFSNAHNGYEIIVNGKEIE